MKREVRFFFTALLFYTRIPCPKWVDHSEEYLKGSSRYFPLIGILVGGLSALVFWIFQFILPLSISILISMAFSIMLTGAFHEDGMADMCDGFGGGWTREKILSIMKDSRIGTFGALGLIFILGFKFLSLDNLPYTKIPWIMLIGHSLSRFIAITFLYTHAYAREEGDSKTRPMAQKMSVQDLIICSLTGLAPLAILWDYRILLVLPFLFLVRFYLSRMFIKWIGGYTGDCLGGVQQITESLFYLSCLIFYHYF